jgi:hypothetical protein
MTQPVSGESPITPQALLLRIADEAGLEDSDLRSLRTTTKMGPWQVGTPFPGDLGTVYLVFALFVGGQGERSTDGAHVPGELRAYCLPRMRFYPRDPAAPVGEHVPRDEVPYVCYTIHNLGMSQGNAPPLANAIIRTDTMLLDTFVEEIAHEFRRMAVLADLVDDNDAECPKCGVGYELDDEDARFCKGCGTKLPEEPPEEAGQTEPAPAPPAVS